jgi:hypothetical protein
MLTYRNNEFISITLLCANTPHIIYHRFYYHTYREWHSTKKLRTDTKASRREKKKRYCTHQIDELILDDLEFRSLSEEEKKYLEEFSNLIILSANNCGIASLKNFPKLDNLEKLELTENRIPANELSALVAYKLLRKLLLGNNKDIKKIDDLKPLVLCFIRPHSKSFIGLI